MRSRLPTLLLSLLPVLAGSGVARAEPELTLRLASWGSLSAGQGAPGDGLVGQLHVAPGIELGEVILLSLLGGATTKLSSRAEQAWNNGVEPRLVAGARVPLPLGAVIPHAWASFFVGGRYERFLHFAADQQPVRRVGAFSELMFGLDWRCAGGSRRCAGRGAPLFARLEAAVHNDPKGRAVLFTGFLQQGFELAPLAGGALAPAVTLQLKQTDRHEETWNDVLELAGGVRWRGHATPRPGLHGSLSVEVRGEARIFDRADREAEARLLVVVGFGLFGTLAGTSL
jgi:hypothetical protein